MSVSDDLVEECHLEMLHDNMDISRLMVNSQQFEESRLNRKIRDARKTRSYEGGASKGKLENSRQAYVQEEVSPTKFLRNFRRLERIGTKGEEVEIHQVRNQLVPNVARSIWVNV